MVAEQKLETMQEEIKLLKGELKQSLASVRDYLLNMELPSSEFSTILAALGGDGEQKVTMKGSLSAPPADESPTEPQNEITEMEEEESIEDEEDMPSEDEDLIDVGDSLENNDEPAKYNDSLTEDDDSHAEDDYNLAEDDDSHIPEDTLPAQDTASEDDYDDLNEAPERQYDSFTPESEMEEQPMDYDNTNTEAYPGIPKVNTLANLIIWVARAKKELGVDQIPTFLEIYGLSGHLTPELKEVIIHLSEITEARSDVGNIAEVWSREMLSLHGIMAGGDAPLHPMIPAWPDADDETQPAEDEIIDVDKSRENPVKLKLVLPNGNGKSQEFCISLSPEEDSDISSNQRSS